MSFKNIISRQQQWCTEIRIRQTDSGFSCLCLLAALEVPCPSLSGSFEVLGIHRVAGSLAAVFDSRDLLWALVGCAVPSLYLKSIPSFQALWLQDCSKVLEVAVRFFFFISDGVCNFPSSYTLDLPSLFKHIGFLFFLFFFYEFRLKLFFRCLYYNPAFDGKIASCVLKTSAFQALHEKIDFTFLLSPERWKVGLLFEGNFSLSCLSYTRPPSCSDSLFSFYFF